MRLILVFALALVLQGCAHSNHRYHGKGYDSYKGKSYKSYGGRRR